MKDNSSLDTGIMTIILDGYNAPVTAGNFVDLVQRGFYDGMDIQRSDGFVIQSGKPTAKGQDGFIDPISRKERTIPLEIMPKMKDKDGLRSMSLPSKMSGSTGTNPCSLSMLLGLWLWRDERQSPTLRVLNSFLLKESELTPSGTTSSMALQCLWLRSRWPRIAARAEGGRCYTKHESCRRS